MRDMKAGYKMSASLLITILLLAACAMYLLFQEQNTAVNASMIFIALVSMLITYEKGGKPGLICTGAMMLLLAAVAFFLYREQMQAFYFWLVWTPLNIFFISRLRTGVAGMSAERDYYRAECARVAMIDSITQMRNRHAYLNDAPIYIKISKRYELDMVVFAIRLKNIAQLREQLGEAMYNEMLEAVSRVMHKTVRTEDLAYLVDNTGGIWCLSMFTRLDSVEIVLNRLKANIAALNIRQGDGTPCKLDFGYGYAHYNKDEDPVPSTLLARATDMADGIS